MADRWEDSDKCRKDSSGELDFKDGKNGYTAKTSSFTAMRLAQVVRAAKDMAKNIHSSMRLSPAAGSTPSPSGGLEALCDRQQLLADWTRITGLPKPALEFQGSDTLLKHQFTLCSKGQIGFIQTKHIVSALPELEERPLRTRRKVTVDGWEREEEEEERKEPSSRRLLDRTRQAFRNNLTMCVVAFPQFSQFDASKQDLVCLVLGPEHCGPHPAAE